MSEVLQVEMSLVRDLMNANPWTARTDTPVRVLRQLMFDRHVRHIPIVTVDGRLRGLVSRSNLVQANPKRRRHYDEVVAAHVMQRDLQTLTPEDGIDEAGRLLLDEGFDCLPVLGEKKRLVGLVSSEDFVRMALRNEGPRVMESMIVRRAEGGYAIAI